MLKNSVKCDTAVGALVDLHGTFGKFVPRYDGLGHWVDAS